jgi:hypothetical protein
MYLSKNVIRKHLLTVVTVFEWYFKTFLCKAF